MRIAVGMLMCLGGLSAAWANDPSPSNPAAAPSQQPATDQGKAAPVPGDAAATAPAAASTATATANAASPPAAMTATKNKSENAPTPAAVPASAAAQSAKKTELTADEKNYLSHGYKLQIRGGEKYFCRSEAQLGTRFATTTCRTAEQMAVATQNSKDFAAGMELPNSNRPGH